MINYFDSHPRAWMAFCLAWIVVELIFIATTSYPWMLFVFVPVMFMWTVLFTLAAIDYWIL